MSSTLACSDLLYMPARPRPGTSNNQQPSPVEARHSLLPAGNIGNIQFLAAMFVGWDIDWTSNQGSRLRPLLRHALPLLVHAEDGPNYEDGHQDGHQEGQGVLAVAGSGQVDIRIQRTSPDWRLARNLTASEMTPWRMGVTSTWLWPVGMRITRISSLSYSILSTDTTVLDLVKLLMSWRILTPA